MTSAATLQQVAARSEHEREAILRATSTVNVPSRIALRQLPACGERRDLRTPLIAAANDRDGYG
jgi:hypothetical protein